MCLSRLDKKYYTAMLSVKKQYVKGSMPSHAIIEQYKYFIYL